MLYLDHAATSPVRREAVAAMWPYLTEVFGNPSSTHEVGGAAAAGLRDARRRVAHWLGVRASEVVFTSGGTEADNLAVKGVALGDPRGRHLLTTAIEHEAVRESAEQLERLHGFSVEQLPVGRDGRVDPDTLREALRPDTTLVSVALANNEVGTVQDIPSLAAVAREAGVPFHTDAVQAGGVLDVRPGTLGVDAMTLSGHKLGAPKGVGVLWCRDRLPLEPVLSGGGQERGRRSGTENVAGAVAFAVAAEIAESERADVVPRLIARRDAFLDQVLDAVPGAILTGSREHRLPTSASFVFPGTAGEAVLVELEQRGVIVSSGSACAAGRDEPSPVLLALGYDADTARTAVRFSLSTSTSADDLTRAVEALRSALQSLGALRG